MRTAAICPTCATYENAICVLYDGPYLPCTGISPLDSIAEALAKIDAAICALGGTTTSSTTSTTTTAGPTTTTTTTIAGPTTTTTSTSVGPTTTTTTTTNCTTGLEYHEFMISIYDSEGALINIQTTPISEACALLPGIQSGSSNSFYPVYVESLTVGQIAIRSFCTPIPTGTYALYDGPIPSITTFIAVVDGVITEILDCSTTTTTTTGTPTTTTSTTAGPTTTTTTTTSCLAGLTQQILITQVNESPGGTIYILPTPIGEACALLPDIQAGSVPILNSTFPERLDGQLFIGANIIYDNCNPVASGTYALYADPLSGVTTFIEVTAGVITDIVNCSTTTTTTTATPTTTTTTTAL